jgi:hypothetical protein
MRRKNPIKPSDIETLGIIAVGAFGLYIIWDIYQSIKNGPSIGSQIGKEICDFGQSSGLNQALAPTESLLSGNSACNTQ